MFEDDIDERIKALHSWFLPDKLPEKQGGYAIRVELRLPGGTFRKGKVMAHYEIIGYGQEMLNLAKPIWKILQDAHEERNRKLQESLDDSAEIKSLAGVGEPACDRCGKASCGCDRHD